ncbi:anaerobic ribonucleoside-triphosphate reductase activating protein [Teredinibacter haidensis]|uniref:anaerobic ribonucleoside-triphosphate reductase activating protein n=1 Tax=Teredinibacter haidensis TaxID=2731755 RepID=UPI00094909D4|nr:anaerobic ribonucleoside-triphosphate reductase activating protein [Teredinibacter haidensis]
MPRAKTLQVGGFQPLTSIDYPGELAAIVFAQGCPWRCVYCHNQGLQPTGGGTRICWQQVMDFLARRRGLLDAVVFSGGEPTAQVSLWAAIEEVKALGFKVGLHSAGIYPRRLKTLLPLIDWIGLDVKAPVDHYPLITGVNDSGNAAWQSARWVLDSGIDYQFRITVDNQWISSEQLAATQQRLAQMGSVNTVVQSGLPVV